MPYIDMKSKTSKPLGVVSKKPKPTIRNSSSLSKLSGHLESITTTVTLTCQDDAKQQQLGKCFFFSLVEKVLVYLGSSLFLMIVSVSSGSDTFARDVETNEPAEMLVEDASQSQAFASSVDDASESVAKMVLFDICSCLSFISQMLGE